MVKGTSKWLGFLERFYIPCWYSEISRLCFYCSPIQALGSHQSALLSSASTHLSFQRFQLAFEGSTLPRTAHMSLQKLACTEHVLPAGSCNNGLTVAFNLYKKLQDEKLHQQAFRNRKNIYFAAKVWKSCIWRVFHKFLEIVYYKKLFIAFNTFFCSKIDIL